MLDAAPQRGVDVPDQSACLGRPTASKVWQQHATDGITRVVSALSAVSALYVVLGMY